MDFRTVTALATGKLAHLEDRYDKVRVLGRGSFGTAWLVKKRNKRSNLYVAKEIVLQKKRSNDALVWNEVKILSRMTHVNVVRYVEQIHEPDRVFILMEHCAGGDLRERIAERRERNHPFSEAEILHLLSQVLAALRYVHSQQLLHRDVKTANIFLSADGTVKLGDFGLTRDGIGMNDHANTVCGTPLYFSPELCESRPYNHKADIWALGCVLYELMTFRHPFGAATSRLDAVQRIIACKYAPPDPARRYTPELSNVLLRHMLVADESKRLSAEQLLCLPLFDRTLRTRDGAVALAPPTLHSPRSGGSESGSPRKPLPQDPLSPRRDKKEKPGRDDRRKERRRARANTTTEQPPAPAPQLMESIRSEEHRAAIQQAVALLRAGVRPPDPEPMTPRRSSTAGTRRTQNLPVEQVAAGSPLRLLQQQRIAVAERYDPLPQLGGAHASPVHRGRPSEQPPPAAHASPKRTMTRAQFDVFVTETVNDAAARRVIRGAMVKCPNSLESRERVYNEILGAMEDDAVDSGVKRSVADIVGLYR